MTADMIETRRKRIWRLRNAVADLCKERLDKDQLTFLVDIGRSLAEEDAELAARQGGGVA